MTPRTHAAALVIAALVAALAVFGSAVAGAAEKRAPLKKNPSTQQTINAQLERVKGLHARTTDHGVSYLNLGKWEGSVNFFSVGKTTKREKDCGITKIRCETKKVTKWWRYNENGTLVVSRKGPVVYTMTYNTAPPICCYDTREDALRFLDDSPGGDFK